MLSKTIVRRNTIGKKENESLKSSFKRTTPTTVIRIITAKNENDPAERGLISGCLV
jgi:hypothetical protein